VILECKESKECHTVKHHYDECVERVTSAADSTDKKQANEDCVEECKFCLATIVAVIYITIIDTL
jgi:hypothetical protein